MEEQVTLMKSKMMTPVTGQPTGLNIIGSFDTINNIENDTNTVASSSTSKNAVSGNSLLLEVENKTIQQKQGEMNKIQMKEMQEMQENEEIMKERVDVNQLKNETQRMNNDSNYECDLNVMSEDDQARSNKCSTGCQPETDCEFTEEVDHVSLKEYSLNEDEETWIPDTDMKAIFKQNIQVTMGMCPLEEVELLAVKLKSETCVLHGLLSRLKIFMRFTRDAEKCRFAITYTIGRSIRTTISGSTKI